MTGERIEGEHALSRAERRAQRREMHTERRAQRRQARKDRRREANEKAKAPIGVELNCLPFLMSKKWEAVHVEKVPCAMFAKTPLHACSLAIQRFFMRHTVLLGFAIVAGVAGGILLLAWFLLLSGFNQPVQYVYEGF